MEPNFEFLYLPLREAHWGSFFSLMHFKLYIITIYRIFEFLLSSSTSITYISSSILLNIDQILEGPIFSSM